MILGMVCARAGSQGLPGKNMLELGGMTLLERAVAKCILSDHIDVVSVSTDLDTAWLQEQIALDPIKPIIWQGRPAHLAGPRVSKWPVWQFMVTNAESVFEPVDFCIDVDVSRPLTTFVDVDDTLRAYMRSESPAMLAVSRAKKNPFYDTFLLNGGGLLRRARVPRGKLTARQDAPPAYEYGGLFAVDRSALFAVDDMWELEIDGNEIERSHTFDIDDNLDWRVVQAIHREGVCA